MSLPYLSLGVCFKEFPSSSENLLIMSSSEVSWRLYRLLLGVARLLDSKLECRSGWDRILWQVRFFEIPSEVLKNFGCISKILHFWLLSTQLMFSAVSETWILGGSSISFSFKLFDSDEGLLNMFMTSFKTFSLSTLAQKVLYFNTFPSSGRIIWLRVGWL